jgi:hypothetical protein
MFTLIVVHVVLVTFERSIRKSDYQVGYTAWQLNYDLAQHYVVAFIGCTQAMIGIQAKTFDIRLNLTSYLVLGADLNNAL